MTTRRGSAQTNTAGVSSRDRTSAGPRSDGGGGSAGSADSFLVPVGAILMWSGTLATIPSGWALCDGTGGTPNLLAKFIKGVATSATNPGTTGGAANHTHANGTLAVTAHATAADTAVTGAGTRVTAGAHVITGAVANASNEPEFYALAFIIKL